MASRHAFYSETHAMRFGYSILPLYGNSGLCVKATHMYYSKQPPESVELVDLEYQGLVQDVFLGMNHHHVGKEKACETCKEQRTRDANARLMARYEGEPEIRKRSHTLGE